MLFYRDQAPGTLKLTLTRFFPWDTTAFRADVPVMNPPGAREGDEGETRYPYVVHSEGGGEVVRVAVPMQQVRQGNHTVRHQDDRICGG